MTFEATTIDELRRITEKIALDNTATIAAYTRLWAAVATEPSTVERHMIAQLHVSQQSTVIQLLEVIKTLTDYLASEAALTDVDE